MAASNSEYAQGEAEYRETWECRKQTLGEDHKDTLNSLHWLGQALHLQRKDKLAEVTYQDG
jgi:hypothetical protein